MSLATASRFAVLDIDDEDVGSNKVQNVAKANKTKKTDGKDDTKKKPKPKKKTTVDTANRGIDQELQNMAFGKAKPKKLLSIPKASTSTVKKVQPEIEPAVVDEDWQKRNEELASKLFEDDIQQAILISKIDYEEKKEFYEAMEKATKETNAANKKKKKIKKDKAVMTLGEFNNLLPSEIDGIPNTLEINGNIDVDPRRVQASDDHFFDRVAQDVKLMMNREQEKEHFKKIEPNIPIDVRLLQMQDELEKKECEIQDLLKERDHLMEENTKMKKMNTKLCNILAAGQMKEKVDAFLKIDELNKEKDELTQEITGLHAALEQEKSKVHALQHLVRTQANRKEKQ